MRDPLALASLAPLLCAASVAHAHAMLDHASPRVGSTIAGAPAELSLWFTQEVEPVFSKIEVRDSNGSRVDEGDVRPDASDPTELHIALKPLPRGTYEVRWQVLSVDTHTTEGRFRFSVDK